MKAWTTKEIQYLKKHALLAETNEVLNIKEMAKMLERTTQSVRNKIYCLQRDGKLPRVKRELAFDANKRPWTAAEEKRLIAMHKQGNPYKEIAEALGRTRASCLSKSAKLGKVGRIKPQKKARWSDKDVQLLLDNIEFDENGYTSNYDELTKLTGKQYSQITAKVSRLRKEGRPIPRPEEGTTSVKAKESMKNFNNARFAQYAKKEEKPMPTEQTYQSRNIAAGSLSIESKEERIIHTIVIYAGVETHKYFSTDGYIIAEIQKEPTSSANEVSH